MLDAISEQIAQREANRACWRRLRGERGKFGACDEIFLLSPCVTRNDLL